MKKPECRATAIGSFPHTDAADAIELIGECLPDAPVWPQLPMLSYFESMCPQYSEGMPGVKVDPKARTIRIETGGDLLGRVEKFYEKYLSDDLSFYAISQDYAAGLHVFMDSPPEGIESAFAVKGHITGPITWGLTVTDESKRASFYNDHLKDCIVKCLARKADWQIARLRELNPEVIIFVDEPYLQSIGSSAVALQPDEVSAKLDEVFDAISAADAAPGIHVCGNSDWGLIAKTKTHIINFDAYEFGGSISLYPNEIAAFIERGGVIAWGVVPSSEKVMQENADSLISVFREAVGGLVGKGINEQRLLEQSLITPSCGVGSLSVEAAERAMRLTREVSDKLRGAK